MPPPNSSFKLTPTTIPTRIIPLTEIRQSKEIHIICFSPTSDLYNFLIKTRAKPTIAIMNMTFEKPTYPWSSNNTVTITEDKNSPKIFAIDVARLL